MKKLILFDIDGTLLTTDGAAVRAFHRALLEVYGTAGAIQTFDFAGRTDTGIARALLRGAGLTDHEIDADDDALWELYLEYLAVELDAADPGVQLMPGITALMDALEEPSHVDMAVCGLLTGNIERGAALKLAAAGLDGRFAFGAYGSDHARRNRLPAIAVRRALEHTGHEFRGTDIIVLGDTPHDITCGRALGVRAIGVATGRHDADALAGAGADCVFGDLSDTGAVLAEFLSQAAPADP